MNDWYPIDSAPKDGTVIIGALIKDGRVWRVHDALWALNLGWYTRNGDKGLHFLTHWIEMPAAPLAGSPKED